MPSLRSCIITRLSNLPRYYCIITLEVFEHYITMPIVNLITEILLIVEVLTSTYHSMHKFIKYTFLLTDQMKDNENVSCTAKLYNYTRFICLLSSILYTVLNGLVYY